MYLQRVLLCFGMGLLFAGCGNGGTYTPPPVPTPSPGPDRLSASGTVAVYGGTYSETDSNLVIGPNPVSTTQNGTVSDTITTSTDASGHTVYTSAESDAFPLRTLSSTTKATVAFQPASTGQTDVRTLSTIETDSTGAVFSTTYGPNNGLQTVIPEQSGTFANDAQETYDESDPGVTVGASGQGTTVARTVNADGSYAELVNIAIVGVQDSNLMASDFSAREELLEFNGGYEFSKPANGKIVYGFYDSTAPGSPTLSTKPDFTAPIPDWIPPSQTKPSIETDTITNGATLDARCPNHGPFAYAPNLVKQTLTAVDAALGTVETRTTQSFDVAGAGSVCVTVDDKIDAYYDYSGQEGPFLLVPSPQAGLVLLNTTIAEAVGLKSLNGSTSFGKMRSSASLKAPAPALLPRSLLVASIQHRVHQALLRRLEAARAANGVSK